MSKTGGILHASPFSLQVEREKKVMDCKSLYLSLTRFSPWIVNAVLEQVHAMPKQGVVSTFSFGRGFGSIICLLEFMDIPFSQVTPQKWKKEIFGFTSSSKKVSIDYVKNLSIEGVEEFLIPKGKKVPHDGVAEAICMALYAQKIGCNISNN